MGFAKEHLSVSLYDAVADIGQCAASHTDGVDFCHIVGNGTQLRHGAKGLALEVQVQSGNDDADTAGRQLAAYIYYSHIKELRFVDTYYIDI